MLHSCVLNWWWRRWWETGKNSVENLIADRWNRFINRYGETDNYLCQMLRWLVQFVCLNFFIYCVCLFPFAKFFSFFSLLAILRSSKASICSKQCEDCSSPFSPHHSSPLSLFPNSLPLKSSYRDLESDGSGTLKRSKLRPISIVTIRVRSPDPGPSQYLFQLFTNVRF